MLTSIMMSAIMLGANIISAIMVSVVASIVWVHLIFSLIDLDKLKVRYVLTH